MRIRVESEGRSTETTLGRLLEALQAVAKDDAEIEAVFECMLNENRIQVMPENAHAA